MTVVPPPQILQPPQAWTARKVAAATLTVLLVAVAFWAAYRFQYAVFMLLAAMMLRVAIKPGVDWLRTRGLPANLSVLIVFSGLAVLLFGLGLLVTPLFADQISALASKLPSYYADLRTTATQSSSSMLQQLGAALPADWITLLPALNGAVLRQNTSLSSVAPAAQFISYLGYGIFLFVATLMMTAYWTLDADRVTRALLMRAPEAKREGWRELIAELEGKVGGYFRGQLVLCGFIFALSTAAFLLMGLPYAWVLGLISGLFEALPMIGPVLGLLPALLIALATAPEKAIWVVLAAIVIQQIENNLLVPRVMDKSVGINPIISILAVAAFSLLFGLIGAVLAIPVAAMLQILIGRLLFKSSAEVGELSAQLTRATSSRSKLSVLRMEARELADDVRKQARRGNVSVTDGATETVVTGAAGEAGIEIIKNVDTAEALEDEIETLARELDSLLAQAESAQQPHHPNTNVLAQPTGALA